LKYFRVRLRRRIRLIVIVTKRLEQFSNKNQTWGMSKLLKSRKKISILFFLPLFLLVGCSANTANPSSDDANLGDDEIKGIVDACSSVYQIDWRNVNFDQIGDFANKFVEIRNKAVSLGTEARATVEGIADLVIEMDLHYDEGRDFIKYELDFNSDTFIEDSEAHDKIWQAGRSRIAEQINTACEPYF
jgi:hypothetical protein